MFIFSEKYFQNFFKIGLKKYRVILENLLSEKTIHFGNDKIYLQTLYYKYINN